MCTLVTFFGFQNAFIGRGPPPIRLCPRTDGRWHHNGIEGCRPGDKTSNPPRNSRTGCSGFFKIYFCFVGGSIFWGSLQFQVAAKIACFTKKNGGTELPERSPVDRPCLIGCSIIEGLHVYTIYTLHVTHVTGLHGRGATDGWGFFSLWDFPWPPFRRLYLTTC